MAHFNIVSLALRQSYDFLNSTLASWHNEATYIPVIIASGISFVYTSGHCHRRRSRMQVKIVAGPLFAHHKIAHFNCVVTEHWLVVLLWGFVTIRKTVFTISYKKFSKINTTKLKIDVVEVSHFIRECVAHWPFVVTLVTDHDGHVATEADCLLSNWRASLNR